MGIYKALDISTGNMKSTDAKILEGYRVDPQGRKRPKGGTLIVDPIGNWGWTISTSGWGEDTSERIQELREEGFSEEFINIMLYAYENDLDGVRFDCDADPEPGFPFFDWESGDTLIEAEASAPKI